MSEKLFLRVTNVSAVPERSVEFLLALASRGVVDVQRAISRRFLTPALHFTDAGRVRVLQDVVDSWLPTCANPKAPSVAELERLLNAAPEFKKAYEVRIDGSAWSLVARAPTRPMRRADWAKGGWQFIFPRGRQRHFFEVSGAEFLPLTELFRCLNGTHTARELGAEFPKHRALIKRFVAFLRTNDLLAPLRRAPPRHPGLEFVSHSSLQFTSDESSVLIDPCFVLPDGQEAISPRDLARFEAKFRQLDQVSAVLLTHSHWDHTHLPTLFRFRRDVPIFVPKVTEETYYNPALAPLLRSLGFTDVREVTPWQPERIGDITFTPVPFYGEWFGPGSHFDAFCYLIELNGVHYLGTVDSERSEAGNMDQVFKELRERVGHSIDCVFFCSSSQTHANPVTCGAPAQYSNGFGIHADLMRYHPNTDAIVRWSRMLKPRVVIPYAEFIFSSTAGRAPINLRAVNAQSHFRDYWRQVESGRLKRLPGVLEWKRDLSRLMPRLPKSTQLVMMSPGERVEA